MKVGFIGLGNMGMPMAANLQKAGIDLTVYNRTPEKAAKLGVPVAESPRAVAVRSDIIITMLSNDEALQEVMLGKNGALAGMQPGAAHLSMSTVGIDIIKKITRAHQEAGHTFISSPVFGRPDAAQKGALIILAASSEQPGEYIQKLYSHIGKAWHYVGEHPWMANLFKMSGNFWITSMIETMGESFALIKKAGGDHEQFFQVLMSVFQSPIYENYGKNILQQHFDPPGFALKHGLKDVSLVSEASRTFAVPMPFVSLLRDSFMQAYNQGKAELDMSALASQIEENAGVGKK